MKNYYEKQVKQIEMERKFIIDGIKAELFSLLKNADADIKKEDLEKAMWYISHEIERLKGEKK